MCSCGAGGPPEAAPDAPLCGYNDTFALLLTGPAHTAQKKENLFFSLGMDYTWAARCRFRW